MYHTGTFVEFLAHLWKQENSLGDLVGFVVKCSGTENIQVL